jgi:hypothetical protein
MKDVDAEVDFMYLTEAETKFMVDNHTLELPSNFYRYYVRKTKAFCTLQYVGFRVRDTFPNNIVRLRTGQILYVTHVLQPRFEVDDGVDGTVSEQPLEIHGKLFEKVIC